MLKTQVVLTCDGNGENLSFDGCMTVRGGSIIEVRRAANAAGWKEIKFYGRVQDYCPDCAPKIYAALQE